MDSQKKRLEEIERKGGFNEDPEVNFIAQIGEEWTEEKKEWIQRRHPDCKYFMKPLSNNMPFGFERQGEEAVALYKDLGTLVNWSPERQQKHDDEIRKRVEEESRMISRQVKKSREGSP